MNNEQLIVDLGNDIFGVLSDKFGTDTHAAVTALAYAASSVIVIMNIAENMTENDDADFTAQINVRSDFLLDELFRMTSEFANARFSKEK